ncbi:133aa long hypothetical protein [Pyrococcus horikoshii OT3]|uniref:Uncharacterized protein n=1 Tax=Pyrococcus horikoshii (strain ATCC 700860 / DSM 12428 / JCM 9974 / NBRC 100139 / OT-3) TaxID=70601 RepID=O59454_PYRHO|nr:133aa long hypothetical protein [Pyrococcus horikoshii OT3]
MIMLITSSSSSNGTWKRTIRRIASTFGSFVKASKANLYLSASVSPTTSVGFPTTACGGNLSLKNFIVSSLSSASFNPNFATASLAITPAPPPSVIIPILSPLGNLHLAKALAKSNMCSKSSALIIPVCLKTAS